MCDLKLDLADIFLWAYYTYTEVQVRVANTARKLVVISVVNFIVEDVNFHVEDNIVVSNLSIIHHSFQDSLFFLI